VEPLTEFFQALKAAGDEKYFHPHPLTATEAENLCHYRGKDLYYLLVDGRRVLAYGLLRGWDEGYEVPSLGIAVHPSERGSGTGLMMMEFLHMAARRRGARNVRLKVHKDNSPAIRLYEGLGYVFQVGESDQLVGVIDL